MMLLRKQNRRASITRARKAPISPPPGAHSLRFLEGKDEEDDASYFGG